MNYVIAVIKKCRFYWPAEGGDSVFKCEYDNFYRSVYLCSCICDLSQTCFQLPVKCILKSLLLEHEKSSLCAVRACNVDFECRYSSCPVNALNQGMG